MNTEQVEALVDAASGSKGVRRMSDDDDDDTPYLVIVPESLDAAITAKLDAALDHHPAATAEDRAGLYRELLYYFSKFGHLPDFTVVKRSEEGHGT